MNYLYITPVKGLFDEFYNPNPDALVEPNLFIHNNRLDASNYFWGNLLNSQSLDKLLDIVSLSTPTLIQYTSVLADRKLFIENVTKAKMLVADYQNSPQTFFSYLETLNIVCKMYTDYVFFPYTLSLQEGFLLNDVNAKAIWENCLNPTQNPYFDFITRHIVPLIAQQNPKIIFFEGKPDFYSLSIAKYMKYNSQTVVTCFTRHASEYYSLNKIDFLLRSNNYFFRLIDIVILDYFQDTEKRILNGESLEDIPNIIYKNLNKGIVQNKYESPASSYGIESIRHFASKTIRSEIDSSAVSNVHLEPYIKCFWNKCAFCGINKKYHFDNISNDMYIIQERLEEIKKIVQMGVKYIWFIDEAIVSEKLFRIANFFIEHSLHVIWQARSRISTDLLDENLADTLSKAGLRELRLGLESASLSVLKKMNKFDSDFSLALVEKICELFSRHNISIHFPMIIGFPGETEYDRKQTYEFLRTIHDKYPQVTFNINLFGLDVQSPLFHNWTDYAVMKIHFPCLPANFLGNIVEWEGKNKFKSSLLAGERDRFMRDILYPWMPPNALLEPYIFYRLSETMRITLFWKSFRPIIQKKLSKNTILILNRQVTIVKKADMPIYVIYNWSNHHYIMGNDNTLQIFNAFQKPAYVSTTIKQLHKLNPDLFNMQDIKKLIYKLYTLDYFVEKNNNFSESQ